MPDYSKKIIYLSQAQYEELVSEGTITVSGVTVTYNANDIYVTPQENVLNHTLTFGAGQQYVFDGSEDVTVPVYTGSYSQG